jgi:hypothetical protein
MEFLAESCPTTGVIKAYLKLKKHHMSDVIFVAGWTEWKNKDLFSTTKLLKIIKQARAQVLTRRTGQHMYRFFLLLYRAF